MALVPDARMEEQHERHIVQYTITVWWYCMEHAHVRVISPTLPSLPTSRQARPRAIATMVCARAAPCRREMPRARATPAWVASPRAPMRPPYEVAIDVADVHVGREADGDAATLQA